MRPKVEKVIKEAMEMPTEDRAAVAERLISSLDLQTEPDVEAVWQEEARRRLAEIRSGGVATVPWESVRERLRKKARATP